MHQKQHFLYNVAEALALILATTVGSQVVTCAYAQNANAQQAKIAPPGVVSGLPEGVTVVSPPPPGFNPTTASAEENARYLTPPEPNAETAPKAHAAWAEAVTGTAVHEAPTLTKTNIFNGPVRGSGGPKQIDNSSASTTSSNWSGSTVYGPTNPQDKEAIIAYFVVPTAHQAFNACTGGWDWSSVWPGIDGWGSNDVLQGGIEADAYCSGGTKSAYYSAWIEWYPFNEVRVSSPAISPGDYLFVEVWNTTPTQGYVYFHDYSTNVTAEYSLTAPSGTTLAGNSVEWIVERPTVNGSFATLTNYIDVTLTGGIAWDYTASPATYYYPYYNPSVGTLYLVTMLDNNSQAISTGYGLNAADLFFEDYGSACGLNTTSPPC